MQRANNIKYVLGIEQPSIYPGILPGTMESHTVEGWDVDLARRTCLAMLLGGREVVRFQFVTVEGDTDDTPGTVVDRSPWHYFGKKLSLGELTEQGGRMAEIAEEIRQRYPNCTHVIDTPDNVVPYGAFDTVILDPLDLPPLLEGRTYVEYACLGPLVGDITHVMIDEPVNMEELKARAATITNAEGRYPYGFRIFKVVANGQRDYHEAIYYLEGTLRSREDVVAVPELKYILGHMDSQGLQHALFLTEDCARPFVIGRDIIL